MQMPTAVRGRDGAERGHGRLGGGTLEENEQHLVWGYPEGREPLEGIEDRKAQDALVKLYRSLHVIHIQRRFKDASHHRRFEAP